MKAASERESWAKFNLYLYAWCSILSSILFAHARKNYATVEIHPKFKFHLVIQRRLTTVRYDFQTIL